MPISGSLADSNQIMQQALQSLLQQQDRVRSRGQGQGSVGNTDFRQLDPAQGSESFRSMLDQINQRVAGLAPPSYESFLQQGINSPLLQAVLGPALAKLQPGADESRQAL